MLMATESKPGAATVEIAMPIQLAGFALLVMFAATFGARWALLAGGLVLLFLGFVLSGVTIRVGIPVPAPDPAREGGR